MMTIKDKQLNNLFSHWYESKILMANIRPPSPLKIVMSLSFRSDVLHEYFSVSYHPATDEATSHI